MLREFKTAYSSEEFMDRLKHKVSNSLFVNWHRDCIVGKVRKKSFYYYFHKAYIRNSFNKYLYGRVIVKDGNTIIKTIIISPMLSLKLHIKLVSLFCILNLLNFDVNTYFSKVFSIYLVFGGFLMIMGVISQLIPISDEKRRILYGVIEESIS